MPGSLSLASAMSLLHVLHGRVVSEGHGSASTDLCLLYHHDPKARRARRCGGRCGQFWTRSSAWPLQPPPSTSCSGAHSRQCRESIKIAITARYCLLCCHYFTPHWKHQHVRAGFQYSPSSLLCVAIIYSAAPGPSRTLRCWRAFSATPHHVKPQSKSAAPGEGEKAFESRQSRWCASCACVWRMRRA